MAVIIEEGEKKPFNWMLLMIIGVIVIIIFVGGYYLFFKKPELIEVVAPRELEPLEKISQVEFDPTTVLNSTNFKILRQFTVSTTPPAVGRSNPFIPVRSL